MEIAHFLNDNMGFLRFSELVFDKNSFKFVGRKLHFLQIYVGRLRVGLKKGVELLRPATVEVMRSAGAGARDAGRCQSPDLPFRYRCCNRFLPDRFGAPKLTVILSDFRRSIE